MNFQRHPFDRLIMRRREIKARIIRYHLKMGGVVTDTNCQRASQSLYETIAVSLFARLPPRALLAASPLARDSCSATFPRGFSSKRETARSLHQDTRKRLSTSTTFKFQISHIPRTFALSRCFPTEKETLERRLV